MKVNLSKKTLRINFKEVLLIGLIVLSIHFTEFKIGVVKLSEIILLLIPPIWYTKKINKWISCFYLIFSAWLILSLLLNPLREFPPLFDLSKLKTPYLITIGRFLELIACVNLAALGHHYLKQKTKKQILFFVEKVVLTSFVFVSFNTIIYFMVVKGVLADSGIVYNTSSSYPRLKGWFIEGGPYGLMLAFIFVLSFLYKSKYNFFIRVVILLNIVFLAKSKSGILLLVFWGALIYYKIIYRKIKSLSILVILLGGIVSILSFAKLAEVYIDSNKNMEKYMKQRPNDTNITMGRIAGSHIVPNMVRDNLMFGIGLGNYPIVRNNPKYRNFVPYTPNGKTDAHGLGGIVQILVDGGFLLLFLFLAILYFLTKNILRLKNDLEIYVFVFLCFFLTGVQIYFLYPWFLLGVLIALKDKKYE